MNQKFTASTLFFIIFLSFPFFSSAKFFDDIGEKLEKETKRTEKRIKKELDRTDENVEKITEKTKKAWEKHKDEIVPVVVAATVIYVGDINLATLALKEYGVLNEDGTIEWDVIFTDDKESQHDQVGQSKAKSSSQMIVYVPNNSFTDRSKSGVMVINRTLDSPKGKTGSHIWIQVVENGNIFIAGGWENSKTGMINIRAADIKTEDTLVKPDSTGFNHRTNGNNHVGHEQLSYIKIDPPKDISQLEWNQKFKQAALDYHRKHDLKLKNTLNAGDGDNEKASGNSDTVIKHILDNVQPGLSKTLEVFDSNYSNPKL